MTRSIKYLLTAAFALTPLAAVSADEGDIVAVLQIKGALIEAPNPIDIGPLMGGAGQSSMFTLLESMKKARADEHLRAVILDIQEAQLGIAQIMELRNQISALRAAEKDVLVFAEELHVGTMMLGSAASRLVLLPTGEVALTGMYGEGLYFKNMLDKIYLEADILHCGDYKSAGEPFYRTGPSKEDEEQTNRLLDSLYATILESIGDSRGLTPEQVSGLVDRGILSAKDALEAKLVDKLQYKEDFISSIKERYGEDAEIVFKYGQKTEGPDLDLENPFAIFKLFSDLMKGPEKSDKDAVAVIYVEGPITTGQSEPGMFGGPPQNAGSDTIRKAIAEAAKDETVKALVLRVNSPGGSAVASDVICEAAERFKASGRPFIVSMGNVAASGGYYVSASADTIYAEPGTITGSIGVVGGKFITKGFWNWIGVTEHEFKRGKHADIMNTNRKWSDDERAVMMDMMNRVYGEFKGRVTDGRGEKLTGEIDSLAGGRVYTGEQAKKIGLVDTLGGFADAVRHAADKAELGSDYELRVYPHPKSIFELLSEAFGGEQKDELVRLGLARGIIGAKFAAMLDAQGALSSLRALDPAKARAVQDFLIQAELLAGENVLLIGPAFTMTLR